MHFLMGDPRKTASIILSEGLRKKPESNGGGEKKAEHSDRGDKILEAIRSSDAASLVGILDELVRAAVHANTDEHPDPLTKEVDHGEFD